MLCPRPLTKVPHIEAYDSTMRLRRLDPQWSWRCPCGTVVRPGLGNVVPSHRIPRKHTTANDEAIILKIFDTWTTTQKHRLIIKLARRSTFRWKPRPNVGLSKESRGRSDGAEYKPVSD